MYDTAISQEVWLFPQILLFGADSQMRWVIGSVNPPSTGASLCFGHAIDPLSTQVCF